LNLITIDSDCSSGFDSAYYSCWCMRSNRFAVVQKALMSCNR
jgi:hypothetical protein